MPTKTKLITSEQIQAKIKDLNRKHNQRIKRLKAQYEKAVMQEEAARTAEQDADILEVYNNTKHRDDWKKGDRAWIWHSFLGEVNFVPIETIHEENGKKIGATLWGPGWTHYQLDTECFDTCIEACADWYVKLKNFKPKTKNDRPPVPIGQTREKMLKHIRKWFYEEYPKYKQGRKEHHHAT